jgi:F-type H+-transporting ATPase subunit d
MVDTFQKHYEALKIPYPADTVSSTIDAQKSEVEKEITNFISQSNSRIAEIETKIAHLKAMLPFEQMTMEDFKDAYPDQAIDPINNPTFWPHEPLTDEEIKAIEEAKNNPHH